MAYFESSRRKKTYRNRNSVPLPPFFLAPPLREKIQGEIHSEFRLAGQTRVGGWGGWGEWKSKRHRFQRE